RATASAPSKLPARISFENFGEPVILVRSPITAKPNSGVIFSGSSPDNSRAFVSRSIFFSDGVRRGNRPTVELARLAIAYGVYDCRDVLGGCTAAAAHKIQPAVCCPSHNFGCKRLWSFRKSGRRKRIGQSCIRIRADVKRCDP